MNAWKKVVFACIALLALGLIPVGAALAQVRVTAANPASAQQGTIALDVVVSGNGFDPSAKVSYFVSGTTNPGGITVRRVAYRNSKELVTTIDVDDAAVLAYYDIQVTLQSGRKGKGTTLFSVTRKSGSVDSYVAESLGTLPGDQHSEGWGINSSGRAVGRSSGAETKAFYWDGTMHQLPMSTEARTAPPAETSWDVEARAISNGPDEIVVGREERTVCEANNGPCAPERHPIIWRGNLTQGPSAIRLSTGAHPGTGGAEGISPSGTIAVGHLTGAAGAVWKQESGSWNLTDIPLTAFPCNLCKYDSGVAIDVNDEGLVVGLVSRQDNYLQYGYLYDTRNGAGMLLPMPPGYLQSNGRAIVNVAGGKVYVSGVVWPCENISGCRGSRAVRWTVDVGTFGSSFELLDMGGGFGVSEQGDVVGTRFSTPGKRKSTSTASAFLWRISVGYIPLEPLRGDPESKTSGLSVGEDGALYVVGYSMSSTTWSAVRWIVR